MQPDNPVAQKFDTRKIYQLSNEVFFFAPIFVCFSLFAFKLGATVLPRCSWEASPAGKVGASFPVPNDMKVGNAR